MIPSVLDHHDDKHPVEKNARALSTKDRKFVFTVFFVLSVFSIICSDCS